MSERGIILFNLGGPESLDDVRPFLYNLFSDPDIIRIPNGPLRKSLAWLIAATRQRKSKNLYRQIGGGSPLRRITEGQATALAMLLAERGCPARVYVAMRCWKPGIDEAVARMGRDGIREAVALPLFPQFSLTTTGSCFNYLRRVLRSTGLDSRLRVRYVDAWYEEPLYVRAVAELIREAIARLPDADPAQTRILYSAHSVPASYVEKEGDPYLEQTKRSVELIQAALGDAPPALLAFQSKVGPVRWLEPATNDVLLRLGREGVRGVVVVPISFVSDHIETLQEIDIAYRNLALRAGIRSFERAASLNLHPTFIEALAAIALRQYPQSQ